MPRKLSSLTDLKSQDALVSAHKIPGTYSFGMLGPQGDFKALKTSLYPRLWNSIDFFYPFYPFMANHMPTPQAYLRTSFQCVLSSQIPCLHCPYYALISCLLFSVLCLHLISIRAHILAVWFPKLQNNIEERGNDFTVKYTWFIRPDLRGTSPLAPRRQCFYFFKYI